MFTVKTLYMKNSRLVFCIFFVPVFLSKLFMVIFMPNLLLWYERQSLFPLEILFTSEVMWFIEKIIVKFSCINKILTVKC